MDRSSRKRHFERMLGLKSMLLGNPWGSIVRIQCHSLLMLVLTLFHRIDRALRVPAEEAAQSGLSRDQVQINPKYGGGYPANVEGLHHLHCLVSMITTT